MIINTIIGDSKIKKDIDDINSALSSVRMQYIGAYWANEANGTVNTGEIDLSQYDLVYFQYSYSGKVYNTAIIPTTQFIQGILGTTDKSFTFFMCHAFEDGYTACHIYSTDNGKSISIFFNTAYATISIFGIKL